MVKSASLCFLVCALELMLHGCGGTPERSEARPSAAVTPWPGKALVVFVRPPSGLTFVDYARAPVFRAQSAELVLDPVEKNSEPEIVGILPANTKIAYQIDPGKHLFMAVGEGADFMAANVLANRIYYAVVLAQPGKGGRPHYSFKAVDRQEQGSKDFKELLEAARWVVKTRESLSYAASNMAAIKIKQYDGHRFWIQTTESERPNLLPDYGTGQ